MRHGAEGPGPCPIHELLEVLSRPWTMHILWTLSTQGPTRFGELRRQVERRRRRTEKISFLILFPPYGKTRNAARVGHPVDG